MCRLKRKFNLLAMALAVLSLCSPPAMALDLHFCQDDLKSFGIILPAKSCAQIEAQDHCSKDSACTKQKRAAKGNCAKDCCSNQTMLLGHDIESFPPTTVGSKQSLVQCIEHIVSCYEFIWSTTTAKDYVWQNRPPPNRYSNTIIFLQRFLI